MNKLSAIIFLYSLSSLLIASSIPIEPKNKDRQSPKPNILTIILDDAGWMDVGYHGSKIKTPEIDKLAKNGVQFSHFYTYSTCSPTRAAFFSGKAPSRSGLLHPVMKGSHAGLDPNLTTLPEALRDHGYQTALIGKWHLGEEQAFQPSEQGFDYSYGNLGGWVDQYTRVNPKDGYDWYRNGKTIDFEPGHCTDLITDEALRHLHHLEQSKQPWFMCLSYTAPHVPIQVDPKWAAPYLNIFNDKTKAGYAGMMSHLDFSIGRVIKSLKNRKVLKDTLIVIFSDNGPSKPGPKWYINSKDHQKNFWGNNGAYGSVGSLRGWKATPHEGGIRVPLAIHWEGKIQPTTYHKPAQIQDLYPTILNAIGIDLNTSHQVEGRNLYPSIINPSLAPAPVNFYWRDQNTLTYRMNHWKLIIHHPSPFSSDARSELFNLNDDMNESDNCIARFPKIYKKMLSHLREEYRNDPEVHVDPFMRGK